MIVVLDTNVIISGLLKPFSPPAAVLRLAASGMIRPAHDFRILTEYREVLSRPRFGFPPKAVEDLLRQIEDEGLPVTPPPLPYRLTDPWDEPFLEVTLEADAEALITGNKRHFRGGPGGGIAVLTPAEFLRTFGLGKNRGR
jgi:putative PIN family toxin of toxin-antitoxin system